WFASSGAPGASGSLLRWPARRSRPGERPPRNGSLRPTVGPCPEWASFTRWLAGPEPSGLLQEPPSGLSRSAGCLLTPRDEPEALQATVAAFRVREPGGRLSP